MRFSRFLVFCLSYACLLSSAAAQYVLNGDVGDARTLKPLAFVNIVEKGKNNGTISDIDGHFSLQVDVLPVTLQFSYLGYEKKTLTISSLQKDWRILLSPLPTELREAVIVPGENPADRIIRRLINRRDSLDPKKLNSFSYVTYNKLVFTSMQDTSKGEVSTGLLGTVDSTEIKVRQFFNQQHLFLNESVTERKFKKPDLSYENVIASHTSGLQDPIISTLSTQLQSLSFYEEYFDILNFKYLNPLSKNALGFYYFQIEDTTYSGTDTVVVISFHPRRGKKFEALEGVLNVNLNEYALESARAEPYKKDQITLRILHKYERIDSACWFPVQQNTDVILNSFSVGNIKLVAEGRSYIRDIQINPPLKRSEFSSLEVDVREDAVKNGEVILEKYRIAQLNRKDSVTYRTIDSLGKKFNIERRLNTLEALMDGKLRLSIIDVDLARLVTFNNYEGFRLGLGLSTNERMLKWFKIGGYFAYGFKDKAFKYGGFTEFRVHRRTDTRIKVEYRQDLVESGNTDYPMEGPLDFDNFYRSFILGKFDSIQVVEGSIRTKPVQNLWLRLAMNYQIINPVLPYRFLPDSTVNPTYKFTEIDFTLRWGIKEKYMTLGSRYVSMGNKYPVIWFTLAQCLPGVGGPYSYTRIQARVEQTIDWKKFGKTHLELGGGYVFGDAPYTKLYNERGSYSKFSLVSWGAFETMRANEFLSDAYISFYFRQGTGTLFKVKRWMRPEIFLVHNMGFGWLRDPGRHSGIPFKTMEKGFFEAGLVLDKFITLSAMGLGVGVFYRYGPYSSPDPGTNFHVKMALSVGF